MFSICLIYSNDRRPQTEQVIRYLSTIDGYHAMDKMVVSDGYTDFQPPDFRVIQVHRKDRFYCRAAIWDAAVLNAKFPVLMVLDGDRLPHQKFFVRARHVPPDTFIYCRRLYQLYVAIEDKQALSLLRGEGLGRTIIKPDFRCKVEKATIKAAKNPMAGGVVFWREAYLQSGGMSHDYRGWGFNDVDYYMKAFVAGYKFVPLELPELHLHHGYEVKPSVFLGMNIWNGIRFYDKWRLPIHPKLEPIMHRYGLTADFVRRTSLEWFVDYMERF